MNEEKIIERLMQDMEDWLREQKAKDLSIDL